MCSNPNDPYNKFINELEQIYMQEIVAMYKGFSEYYQKIYQESNRTIVNWLFALNTGGIAYIVSLSNKLNNKYWFFVALPFLLGIVLIYAAIFFERGKFDKLGIDLEKIFEDFNNNKITANNFIQKAYDLRGSNIPKTLENISFISFTLGVIALIVTNF